MHVNTTSNGFVEISKENHWVLNDTCIHIYLKLNIVANLIQYTTGFFFNSNTVLLTTCVTLVFVVGSYFNYTRSKIIIETKKPLLNLPLHKLYFI